MLIPSWLEGLLPSEAFGKELAIHFDAELRLDRVGNFAFASTLPLGADR
jgi:hypothetical protein